MDISDFAEILPTSFILNLHLNSFSAEKLEKLEKSGRNMLVITDAMIESISKAIQIYFDKDLLETASKEMVQDELKEIIAEAARKHIINRFLNGAEYPMRNLSANTVKIKHTNRIGIASGDLLSDIKNCQISFEFLK
jgi:hypothetical protein